MEIFYSLAAVFMQELFENGLFDINELSNKYNLNREQQRALKEIYNEYYNEN